MRESFAQQTRWGWKDPRTCMTLAFWQRLLPSLRYVICVRHPLDVAASLEARDGIGRDDALALWCQSTTSAILGTSGRPRVFVTFESWFPSWERNAQRLADFVSAAELGEEQRARIATYLDEPLWHHRAAESRDLPLPAEALALHEALVAIGSAEAEPDAAAHGAVDELARRVAATAQV